MPTAIKLHRMPHINPLVVYEILLLIVSVVMLGLIALLVFNTIFG